MNSRTSAALAWGGVLLAGVLWGVGALVAQSVMAGGGMSPFSLSLARFALGLPLLWWWHWRQMAATPSAGQWRNLPWQERALVVVTGLAMAVFNIAGALLGSRLALRHGSSFVRWVFIAVASILIARLGYDTFA